MLSKSQITFVNSLKRKKYRDIHRCFIAEGSKLVTELLNSRFTIQQVFATAEWEPGIPLNHPAPVSRIKQSEMERISALRSPSQVLAVVEMDAPSPDPAWWETDITLLLDAIQDPGNLGSIIRIADWFGVRQVVCSPGCVDFFNPKVVQATMGSIARVQAVTRDLKVLLEELNGIVPVYGMMLEGKNLYEETLVSQGFILIGSEAHGISRDVSRFVTHRLFIPYHPRDRREHAESLNAAVAAGIVCAEFRNREQGTGNREEGRSKK